MPLMRSADEQVEREALWLHRPVTLCRRMGYFLSGAPTPRGGTADPILPGSAAIYLDCFRLSKPGPEGATGPKRHA